ncbi:MAG: AAA family ATPase [Candidatus Daviesbacteria bacterium]
MAKLSSIYICQQCGFRSFQFLGKCPECGTWGSLVESVEETEKSLNSTQKHKKVLEIINLSDVKRQDFDRLSTGISEFDRVLGGPASPDGGQGGGIVLGSVVLVSGDPGIGKSTLLTQLAINMNQLASSSGREKPLAHTSRSLGADLAPDNANNPNSALRSTAPHFLAGHDFASQHNSSLGTLYVAGEESAQQIKFRVDRIKKDADLSILNETDVDGIVETIEVKKPSLVIVDSIQTMETSDLNGVAGSVGQVRECAHRLQRVAKALHIPIFLVGHITKEGNIAGPKTLEHLVDVVLSVEGDPTSNFRILRVSKNRFGPTDEVGIFQMEEKGMVEVKNPSEVFLSNKVDAPGSAVAITMNGFRPLLIEIQALVTKSLLPIPVRRGSGIDNNRLQLLVAVLSKRLGLLLFNQDIFVNVTGGLKVYEPSADLAICLAIISSLKDKTISSKTALMGEVGLLGELRPVRNAGKRESEAKKLGYTKVISPENIKSLAQAVKLALS